MKKILAFSLLFLSLKSFGQFPVKQTLGSDSTLVESRGGLKGRIINKVFSDTTQANTQRVKFYDGAQIYTNSAGGQLWLRDSAANKWVITGGPTSSLTSLGSGYRILGAGGIKTITATNGITPDSATSGQVGLKLGSPTALSEYTPLVLNTFPLTILHNGVNSAAQADSNSIRLTNNTAATSTTDSLVSPGVVFKVSSWKSIAGSGTRPVSMMIDALGNGAGSGTGTASFRFRFNPNSTGFKTMMEIKSGSLASGSGTADFLGHLSINGATIAHDASLSNLIFGGLPTYRLGTLTGTQNTAIGVSSLSLNTTGNYNTAVGNGSLSGTKGNGNTAVGVDALSHKDSTDYNTAIGYQALYTATTGYQNTAIGTNALLFTTTGIKNVANGAGALENNTTGGFNTADGMDAMLQNTTGSENVGIGYLAWSQNRTGEHNVGIGNSTGRSVVNGTNNIMIGYNTGFDASQEDTVNNSILLGAGLFSTASNQMKLGTSATTETFITGSELTTDTTAHWVVLEHKTTGKRYKMPVGSLPTGGGGGSGTVTSVDLAYGITGSSDPITSSGTVIADTTILVNKAGAQVISGVKNFTSAPKVSSIGANRVLFPTSDGTISGDANTTVQSNGIGFQIINGGQTSHLPFSDGTFYFRGPATFDAGLSSPVSVSFGGSVLSGVNLGAIASANTNVAFAVKGAASQSANLQEWRNSSNTVLLSVDANGMPAGTIASGTYTPTVTNTTNVSSSNAYACQYMRVGNTVTVSGRVGITPTADTDTYTEFGLSLPIASDLANSGQAAGTGGEANHNGVVTFQGDATNNRAKVSFLAPIDGSEYLIHFSFTYQIL